jgi:hypothetical protein
MIPEPLMAELVRAWSDQLCRTDRTAADRAVATAMRSYAGGASLSEACREARRFNQSWARHPCHQDIRSTKLVRSDS